MIPLFGALRMSWLTSRFFVTRMGLRNFVGTSAGYLLFEAAVEEAAEHSDWVQENKSAILTTSLIASFGVYGALGKRRVASLKTSANAMFSKLKMVGNPINISSVLNKMKISMTSTSFKINLPDGRHLVMEMLKDKRFKYVNNAGIIGAAVLASGFTIQKGQKLDLIDVESTASQIAGVMASLYLNEKEEELRSLLRSTPPLSIMQNGPNIVRSFMHENSGISAEMCVALCQKYLSEENIFVKNVEIDSFVDSNGDEFILINDVAFVLDGNVLIPGNPKGVSGDVVSDDIENLTAAILSFFTDVHSEDGMDFVRVGKTNRFASEMYMFNDLALGFVWDLSTDGMHLLVEEASLFDTAKENLLDALEESSVEFVSRKSSDVWDAGTSQAWWQSIFGAKEPTKDAVNSASLGEVQKTTDMVTYRSLASVVDALITGDHK